MTREWVDDAKAVPGDRRWVMRCDVQRPDGSRCPTQGEPSAHQPPLTDYARAGWFIANLSGDVCPDCLARGYRPSSTPHPVMRGVRVTP